MLRPMRRATKLSMMAQQPSAASPLGLTLERVAELFQSEDGITSREQLDQILEGTVLPPNPRMRTGGLSGSESALCLETC